FSLRAEQALRTGSTNCTRGAAGTLGAGGTLRAGRTGTSAQTLDRESDLPDLAAVASPLRSDLPNHAGLPRHAELPGQRSILVVRRLPRGSDTGDHEQSDYTRKQRDPASLLQGIPSYF